MHIFGEYLGVQMQHRSRLEWIEIIHTFKVHFDYHV